MITHAHGLAVLSIGALLLGVTSASTAADRSPDAIDFACIVEREFQQQPRERPAEIAFFRAGCDGAAEDRRYRHGFVRPASPREQRRLPFVCVPEAEPFLCCGVPGTPAGGVDGLRC